MNWLTLLNCQVNGYLVNPFLAHILIYVVYQDGLQVFQTSIKIFRLVNNLFQLSVAYLYDLDASIHMKLLLVLNIESSTIICV